MTRMTTAVYTYKNNLDFDINRGISQIDFSHIMTKMWRTLVVLGVFIIVFGYVDGRGGGRGGGARGGGSRSRSGSRGSSRSSSVRTYRGPVYSRSSWKTAAAAGTLYGLTSYKRRHLYLRHPDKEPMVCFNENNLRNGTYGYFICPEPDQPDDHTYCCGDDGDQRCCTYSEYKLPQTIRAIVGGVIGGIIVVIITVIVVVCCCRKRKRKQASRSAYSGQVMYHGNPPTGAVTTTTSLPAYSSAAYSTPTDNGMQSDGVANGHTGTDTIPDKKDTTESDPPPAYGFKGGPVDPDARPPPYSTAI